MQRTERPIQTRFRYAYTYRLKLARYTKSLTHYTKGTPSPLRAPTVCRHPVSGSISLPSSGCFSPFPHGTCSLSVMHEYLGLESGLPMFRQDFTCPALLKDNDCSTRTGLSPAMADLSKSFRFIHHCHWPGPRSLATTYGVSVDVLSCRYLDVSVPCVRFLHPMYSDADTSLRYLETSFAEPLNPISRVSSVLTAVGLRTARQTIGDDLKVCMGSPMQTNKKTIQVCSKTDFLDI